MTVKIELRKYLKLDGLNKTRRHNTLYISWRFYSQSFKIMANKLVYSWADKLWQINPQRKFIAIVMHNYENNY